MKTHFENWIERISGYIMLIQKADRAVNDYETRQLIENEKPLIERYTTFNESWLQEQIDRKRELIAFMEKRIIESNKILETLNKRNEEFNRNMSEMPGQENNSSNERG